MAGLSRELKFYTFEVSGADRIRYLQGRSTQDFSAIQPGSVVSSYLLSPQGKVCGRFYFCCFEERALIFAEAESADSFLSELLKFKVADQIEVQPSDVGKVKLLVGDDLGCPPGRVIKVSDKVTGFNTNQISEPSIYLYGELSEVEAGYASLSDAKLKEYFINSVVPSFDTEITSKTIVTDLPLDKYVSFSKGCYAGQEVVERATARGRPNKKLIKLNSPDKLFPGQGILQEGSKVGAVTSCLQLEDGSWVGLGFVKFTSEPDSFE